MTSSVEEWVDEVARTTHPDTVIWCDGSDAENGRLIGQMVDDGTLIRLNQAALPGCYLHRSNPQDVARTEHLTFICSERPEDAGPTNNWMSPADARERVWPLFSGAMRGRTMYVVPYIMGPVASRCPTSWAQSPRLTPGWASRSPTARTSSPTCAS